MSNLKFDEDINIIIAESLGGDVGSICRLLERLRPIIISSINKYYYRNKEDFSDLVQDGYLKIIECLEGFEPKKGVHFLGYVKSKLKFLYLEKNRLYKDSISLNTNISGDNDSTELLELVEDVGINIERDFEHKESIDWLKKALNFLSYRERQVIYMNYFKKMNMYSIADKLGIAYRTVVNIKVKALNKLRVKSEKLKING